MEKFNPFELTKEDHEIIQSMSLHPKGRKKMNIKRVNQLIEKNRATLLKRPEATLNFFDLFEIVEHIYREVANDTTMVLSCAPTEEGQVHSDTTLTLSDFSKKYDFVKKDMLYELHQHNPEFQKMCMKTGRFLCIPELQGLKFFMQLAKDPNCRNRFLKARILKKWDELVLLTRE
jgi:hypothetical protein